MKAQLSIGDFHIEMDVPDEHVVNLTEEAFIDMYLRLAVGVLLSHNRAPWTDPFEEIERQRAREHYSVDVRFPPVKELL